MQNTGSVSSLRAGLGKLTQATLDHAWRAALQTLAPLRARAKAALEAPLRRRDLALALGEAERQLDTARNRLTLSRRAHEKKTAPLIAQLDDCQRKIAAIQMQRAAAIASAEQPLHALDAQLQDCRRLLEQAVADIKTSEAALANAHSNTVRYANQFVAPAELAVAAVEQKLHIAKRALQASEQLLAACQRYQHANALHHKHVLGLSAALTDALPVKEAFRHALRAAIDASAISTDALKKNQTLVRSALRDSRAVPVRDWPLPANLKKALQDAVEGVRAHYQTPARQAWFEWFAIGPFAIAVNALASQSMRLIDRHVLRHATPRPASRWSAQLHRAIDRLMTYGIEQANQALPANPLLQSAQRWVRDNNTYQTLSYWQQSIADSAAAYLQAAPARDELNQLNAALKSFTSLDLRNRVGIKPLQQDLLDRDVDINAALLGLQRELQAFIAHSPALQAELTDELATTMQSRLHHQSRQRSLAISEKQARERSAAAHTIRDSAEQRLRQASANRDRAQHRLTALRASSVSANQMSKLTEIIDQTQATLAAEAEQQNASELALNQTAAEFAQRIDRIAEELASVDRDIEDAHLRADEAAVIEAIHAQWIAPVITKQAFSLAIERHVALRDPELEYRLTGQPITNTFSNSASSYFSISDLMMAIIEATVRMDKLHEPARADALVEHGEPLGVLVSSQGHVTQLANASRFAYETSGDASGAKRVITHLHPHHPAEQARSKSNAQAGAINQRQLRLVA